MICEVVGIRDVLDNQGYQVFYGPRVVILVVQLKPGINAEKLSPGEQIILSVDCHSTPQTV